jgi:DNA-binding MarR family transcriptional regulator
MTTRQSSAAAAAPQALYAVIVEVRRLFHRLANVTDALHEDLGITAAQRAVLEALAETGAAAVPDLARRKGVTRQHIQTLANELEAARLLSPRPNPAHQRSPLLEVTEKGQRTFETIRGRERRILEAVALELEGRPVAPTVALLRDLGDLVERLSPRDGQRRGPRTHPERKQARR